MDKIKENSRLIVAILVALGVLILLFNAGDNSNNDQTDEQTNETTSETAEDANQDEENTTSFRVEEQPGFVVIGRTPSAGKVEVTKENATYSATIRKNDNQTVIARQIVNEYLSEKEKNLSAEQRLCMETKLVATVGRKDVVIEGGVVSIEEVKITPVAEQCENLSPEAIKLWAAYL